MKKSIGAKTILSPSPVLLVGTYDEAGKPNMMNCAWGGICCSKPPCINISLREATYTYSAIQARECFTIGIPSAKQVKEADYIGLVSGRETDKFAELGWTPERATKIDAPYAAELPMVLECKLIHTLPIDLHTLFVGEILDIQCEESVLTEEGRLDMKRLDPIFFNTGDRHYYGMGETLAPAFKAGQGL